MSNEIEKLRAAMKALGLKTEVPWDIADWTMAEQKWREKPPAELLAGAGAWLRKQSWIQSFLLSWSQKENEWTACWLIRERKDGYLGVDANKQTAQIITARKTLEWLRNRKGNDG